MNFSVDNIKNSACAGLNKHLDAEDVSHEIRSKFGNKITVVDEIKFDSKIEATRYSYLKILLKAGLIGLLELQKEYELNEGGTHSVKYVADFVYMHAATGHIVVEDVKGFRTKIYKKKAKLMLKVHGIKIFEVTAKNIKKQYESVSGKI